jgi:4-amino-4-deoxy-L-arabinose transferase-like glycosyltransferase
MPFFRANRGVAAVLRAPALAVVAAYTLRMLVLWLSYQDQDMNHPRLETIGLESLMIAKSLAMGHGFSTPFPRYQAVTAWLAPVYPAIASLGYRIFRLDNFGATLFCQTINSIFSAATCWPIYYLGRRIFSEKIGLASAWLWVVLPIAVLMPLEWIWDQSLSALMLAVVLCATFWLRETSSPLHWSGYGLLWAFAALVNPTLCLLLPFFIPWLVWKRRQVRFSSAPLLVRAGLFFLLALIPWTVRNWFEVGGLTLVKSNFGLEFWLGNNPDVKEICTPEHHPVRDVQELFALILSGEPNYMRAKQLQALAFIRAHPRTFAQLCWGRFVDNWAATYDSRVDPWIKALNLQELHVGETLLFSLVSLAGMFFALRSNASESFPLASCVVLFPIPYYITHTALRYRHPIDPVLTIFAVFALARLHAFVTSWRRRRRSVFVEDQAPEPSLV